MSPNHHEGLTPLDVLKFIREVREVDDHAAAVVADTLTPSIRAALLERWRAAAAEADG